MKVNGWMVSNNLIQEKPYEASYIYIYIHVAIHLSAAFSDVTAYSSHVFSIVCTWVLWTVCLYCSLVSLWSRWLHWMLFVGLKMSCTAFIWWCLQWPIIWNKLNTEYLWVFLAWQKKSLICHTGGEDSGLINPQLPGQMVLSICAFVNIGWT